MVWVPSHVGIELNEKVDVLAKEATSLSQSAIPISIKTAKARIKRATRDEWYRSVRKDDHYLITGGKPPKHEPTTTRLENCILAQLRTGHSPLVQSYWHQIGLTESPLCQHCLDATEDVKHLMLTCPRWTTHRYELLGLNPSIQILNTEQKKVLKFLRKIGRLTDVHGDRHPRAPAN